MQEGRVGELVQPRGVQRMPHVVRAAQRHQAPRQAQVQQPRPQLRCFAGFQLGCRLQKAALCAGPRLGREALRHVSSTTSAADTHPPRSAENSAMPTTQAEVLPPADVASLSSSNAYKLESPLRSSRSKTVPKQLGPCHSSAGFLPARPGLSLCNDDHLKHSSSPSDVSIVNHWQRGIIS